jgi:hypothetical protein
VKQPVLYTLIIIVMLLAACASPGGMQLPTDTPSVTIQTPSATPGSTPTAPKPEPSPTAQPTHIPVDVPPAQHAAIQALADSLGINIDQIKVVSVEAVDWPNGCMGVQRIGVMCTQQIVPGFRIILEANGQQYEYHTNSDGSQVTPAKGQQPIQVSDDAVKAAIGDLAKALGVSEDQVSLVSATIIEWPDSCLGIQQTNIACAQIVTPGYLIVLEANGHQYEYNTDSSGDQVFPASLGLSWTRQGGLAGYCNEMQIYLPNKVDTSSCKPQGNANSTDLTSLVSSSEMDQFNQWLDAFGMVNLTKKDPAVSDAMTQTLLMQGFGQGQPDAAQQQAMFNWAQMVFTKTLSSGQ